jgi:hypothetical protein
MNREALAPVSPKVGNRGVEGLDVSLSLERRMYDG